MKKLFHIASSVSKKIKKAVSRRDKILEAKLLEFQEKEKLLQQQSQVLADANANAAILMAELEAKNEAIKEADAALKKINEELEVRVKERTAELLETNERLHIEIGDRKSAQEQLAFSCSKLQRIFRQTAEALAASVEKRDPYTAGHQKRVALLATAIARDIGFSEKEIIGISIGSVIHDIGKIYVPIEILTKPTKLTDLELGIIRTHPQVGYEILKDIEFEWPVAQIVVQHHERLDGSGYPNGLKGDEISKEARIVCIADIIEAMISHRPYHPARTIDEALEEITRNRSKFYDPEVVDVCTKLFREKGFQIKQDSGI